MLCRVIGMLASGFFLVGSAQGDPKGKNSPSLCKPNEQVFFNCQIAKKKKWVSLCGSKDFSPTPQGIQGQLEYRFGNKQKIELTFPGAKTDLTKAFFYSRYTRPMVTYLSFGFYNQGYQYTLFSEYNAEDDPKAKTECGIRIKTPGKKPKVITLTCQKPVTDKLMDLDDFGFQEAPEE